MDKLNDIWGCWEEMFRIIKKYNLTIEVNNRSWIRLDGKPLFELGDYDFGSLFKLTYDYWSKDSLKTITSSNSSRVKQSGFISLR